METTMNSSNADSIALVTRQPGEPGIVAKAATVVLGRFLFALIFVVAGPMNFSGQSIAHAASQGVPLASFTVPLSGVIALAGALSVLVGYRARVGAWLLVLFLVPVTLKMHAFWSVTDAGSKQVELIMFMKNVALIGAALLISQFGSGPLSLDGLRGRRSRT
jgi:putative oxidoreductase